MKFLCCCVTLLLFHFSGFSQEAPFDFIKGDSIIFADNFAHDRLDTFPSRWKLYNKYLQLTFNNRTEECFKVVSSGATKFMFNRCKSDMIPIKQLRLQDSFTLEFDCFIYPSSNLTINANFPDVPTHAHDDSWSISFTDGTTVEFATYFNDAYNSARSEFKTPINWKKWHHFALSIKGQSVKIYFDDTRILNINDCKCNTINNALVHLFASKEISYSNIEYTCFDIGSNFDQLRRREKLTTRAITFSAKKNSLTQTGKNYLNKLADWLNTNPEQKIEIDLWTDWTDDAEGAIMVTQERADAIAEYLEAMGVRKTQINCHGRGNCGNGKNETLEDHLNKIKTEIKLL